eukprot:gene12542-13327_t
MLAAEVHRRTPGAGIPDWDPACLVGGEVQRATIANATRALHESAQERPCALCGCLGEPRRVGPVRLVPDEGSVADAGVEGVRVLKVRRPADVHRGMCLLRYWSRWGRWTRPHGGNPAGYPLHALLDHCAEPPPGFLDAAVAAWERAAASEESPIRDSFEAWCARRLMDRDANAFARLWVVHCPGSDTSASVLRSALLREPYAPSWWSPAGGGGAPTGDEAWESCSAVGGAPLTAPAVFRPRLDWTQPSPPMAERARVCRPPPPGTPARDLPPPSPEESEAPDDAAALICGDCCHALRDPPFRAFRRKHMIAVPPAALSNDMLGAVPRCSRAEAEAAGRPSDAGNIPAWVSRLTRMDRPFDTCVVLHRGAAPRQRGTLGNWISFPQCPDEALAALPRSVDDVEVTAAADDALRSAAAARVEAAEEMAVHVGGARLALTAKYHCCPVYRALMSRTA